MHIFTRRGHRRAGLIATMGVALGLAGPLTAQEPGWTTVSPKPLNGWNSYPSASGGESLPPTGGPIEGPMLSPGDELPRRPEVKPSQPITPTNPQPKIWTVTPVDRPMNPNQVSMPTGTPERNPQDFGTNLKNAINQHVLGIHQQSPAAALTAPAGGVLVTHPEWGWHGYGDYNTHSRRSANGTQPISSGSLSADLAPYLKYAHLWHPTHNGFQTANLSAIQGEAPPATTGMAAPAPLPTVNSPVSWRGSDGSTTVASDSNVEQPIVPKPMVAAVPPPPPPPVRTANYNGPEMAPAPPNTHLPLQVRQRVSEVCAGRAFNLAVEQLSPIRLRVGMSVKTHADAEWITSQLAALPELRPYKVDFEMQIGE